MKTNDLARVLLLHYSVSKQREKRGKGKVKKVFFQKFICLRNVCLYNFNFTRKLITKYCLVTNAKLDGTPCRIELQEDKKLEENGLINNMQCSRMYSFKINTILKDHILS